DDAVAADPAKLAVLHGRAAARGDQARARRVTNQRGDDRDRPTVLHRDRGSVNRTDLTFEYPAAAVPSGQYSRSADVGDRASAKLGIRPGRDHCPGPGDIADHGPGDGTGGAALNQ